MGKSTLVLKEDINDELIDYIDKYIKTVIINTKRRYYKNQKREEKYGVVLVELEKFEENLFYEEPGYNDVVYDYIVVDGINIPVYNPCLYEALSALTNLQRTVLIKNIVLDLPLKDIAHMLGISKRMAEKHKHNALKSVRKKMKKLYESETQV